MRERGRPAEVLLGGARLVRRNLFGFAILACAAVAFSFPSLFDVWCGVRLMSLVVPTIQLIMFGMGTTLSVDDFMGVARMPVPVLIGVSLQFLVMPAAGFLLARLFGLSGELAAGVVLVGSVAGGTASNVVAYLARANVALSVTMTCISTLLSPLVTPLMMKFYAGQFISIDVVSMMVEMLKVVVVPVVAGCIVHRVFARQFSAHKVVCDRVLSFISMAGICFTILVLTAPSRAKFAEAGLLIILAAVLHNSFGYASGYWLTRLAGRFLRLGETEARTVAIEVGMQNSGMAGALAVGVLNSPVAALPASVFSIWMNFSGSVLASFWSRRRIGVLSAVLVGMCATCAAVEVPRVWTSVYGCRTAEDFERMAADCAAHGVQVVASRGDDVAFLSAQLASCRRHGLKMSISIRDACKADGDAKKTGLYELAVMSGGCYRGRAIDRNLFAFKPGRHEIDIEQPVYSHGRPYAKHPHYYMLGDGHNFGGYVPTGKAEVVVPERLFDGSQHLRILPAKVEWTPPKAKLTFDLTGMESCRLDKVGLVVYWAMDDKSPAWKPERTCYSVFSPHTRQRMKWRVRAVLDRWRKANGGTFPADVVVAARLGDEIFNATGFLNSPVASYPLWGFSASAQAAFAAVAPAGVAQPRTWGAPEVYGADACALSLYLFHKACADYLKVAVDELHAAVPTLLTFRNTTRSGVWSYTNDHDGTGQELLAGVLDFVHLDPYPVGERGYNAGVIPFDMAYMAGLARRFAKPLVPWLQAHRFQSGKLTHPAPEDLRRMYAQHMRFSPDGIVWLGYGLREGNMTFPDGDPAAWAEAAKLHADFARRPPPVRPRPAMAVLRPYSARALANEAADGMHHPEDAILRDFVRVWSVEMGNEYDIFEIPPFETEDARARRASELAHYRHVVTCVDWPGATNVAAGCSGKVFTKADFAAKREDLRRQAAFMAQAGKGVLSGLNNSCMGARKGVTQ